MSLGKEGKALWKKLGPSLIEMGAVSEADWLSLLIMCSDYQELHTINQTLEDEGNVVVSKTGWKVLHPLVLVKDKAINRILRIARDFGLSPLSRQRLSGAAAPATEFDAFLDE